MEALRIINGVKNRDLYENVERSAFLEGFSTCSLDEYIKGCRNGSQEAVLLLIDQEGLEKQPADIINVLAMRFPVIQVSDSIETMTAAGFARTGHQAGVQAVYPFTRQMFVRVIHRYIGQEMLENRVMAYGNLQIDRFRRTVYVKGTEMQLRRYEFDILLLLISHMGEVVSREYINQSLPYRERSTARNVDVHITGIRKATGLNDVIQCVRKIGYCISEEGLYQKMKVQEEQ